MSIEPETSLDDVLNKIKSISPEKITALILTTDSVGSDEGASSEDAGFRDRFTDRFVNRPEPTPTPGFRDSV